MGFKRCPLRFYSHPKAFSRPRALKKKKHPERGGLPLPVLQPPRRAADRRPRRAPLARRRDDLGERGRGLSALQFAERQSPGRRGRDATHPRAGASEVRVLDAYAATPTRALAPRLVAQVSSRRPDALLK